MMPVFVPTDPKVSTTPSYNGFTYWGRDLFQVFTSKKESVCDHQIKTGPHCCCRVEYRLVGSGSIAQSGRWNRQQFAVLLRPRRNTSLWVTASVTASSVNPRVGTRNILSLGDGTPDVDGTWPDWWARSLEMMQGMGCCLVTEEQNKSSLSITKRRRSL